MKLLAKDRFSWDDPSDDATVFEGWHNPSERWNGWATPAFEKSEADRLMAHQQEVGGEEQDRITFDVERDAYVITNPAYGDDESLAQGFDADCDVEGVGGKTKHLYAIGGWSWTWMEVGGECGRCGEALKDEPRAEIVGHEDVGDAESGPIIRTFPLTIHASCFRATQDVLA